MRGIIFFITNIFFFCCLAGCNKAKFLDERPRTDYVVPTTLDDFQNLIDNDIVMSETPALGELSADNFYTTPNLWQLVIPKEQNAYIWAKDVYKGIGNIDDWNFPYKQVFYANVILDGLMKLPPGEEEPRWNHIKGQALFIRGYAFFNLAQVFAPAYNETTANDDLGIPLRLSPNIDEKSKRSTVNETYERIIEDLTAASQLLADTFPFNYRNRPSKMAAYAQLARVYLGMRKYDKAYDYADSCLLMYSTLINYNSITNLARPFDRYNAETIYQSRLIANTSLIKGSNPNCIIDSNLYKSYPDNDLRRQIFFGLNSNNQPILKIGYYGNNLVFSGLATDEMYLIRAECNARAGKISNALNDLNTLLETRWKTGTFQKITALTAEEALNKILIERRKELLLRGTRWTDLRRLNLEGANIKLMRKLNGNTYELLPNSKLYVLPIPPDVLLLGGIQDNDRS